MEGSKCSLGPGSLVGNRGEGEGATEPGDMPLMPPIHPPVISL